MIEWSSLITMKIENFLKKTWCKMMRKNLLYSELRKLQWRENSNPLMQSNKSRKKLVFGLNAKRRLRPFANSRQSSAKSLQKKPSSVKNFYAWNALKNRVKFLELRHLSKEITMATNAVEFHSQVASPSSKLSDSEEKAAFMSQIITTPKNGSLSSTNNRWLGNNACKTNKPSSKLSKSTRKNLRTSNNVQKC